MTDELTTEQLGELRAELLRLVDDLQRQLDASREGARPVDLDEPIGRLTRMDAIQQQKMTEANRRDIQLRRQQIQAALQRFEKDDYGFCIECEEPVGFSRLRARPEAVFCVDCQSRREQ